MTNLFWLTALLVSFATFAQQKPRVSVGISPVPIFPADGQLTSQMDNEYVFLDPHTTHIIVAYPTGPDKKRTVRTIERGHRVLPTISVITRRVGESIQYAYQVTNDQAAGQPMHRIYIDIPAPQAPDPAKGPPANRNVIPQGWSQTTYSYRPGRWAFLLERQGLGVRGKAEQVPVVIESNNLPGLGQVFVEGERNSPLVTGLPEAVMKRLAAVQQLEFNSVATQTVVPKFVQNTSKVVIAMDYSGQFQRLRLRLGESPFIAEALRAIDEFLSRPRSEGVSSPVESFPTLRQKPAIGAVDEEQAYQAMKLALNF